MKALPCLTVLAVEALRRGASDIHLCVGLPPILRIGGSGFSTDFERQTAECIEELTFCFIDRYTAYRGVCSGSSSAAGLDLLRPDELAHSRRAKDKGVAGGATRDGAYGLELDSRLLDSLSGDPVDLSSILAAKAADYREGDAYQSFQQRGYLCVTAHPTGLGHFRVLLVRELGHLNVSIRVHPWTCPNLLSPCWPDELELGQGIWLTIGSGRTTLMASFIQQQIELGKQVHILEQYSEYLFEGAASQNALGTDSVAWRRECGRLAKLVAQGNAAGTVVAIDELQHPAQIKFAIELAQQGVTVFAGHYARDVGSLMNHLADRSSRPTFQRLLPVLTGIVSQCQVATTSEQIAAALKLVLVDLSNRPYLSDPSSVDESKLTYRLTLDDSLISLVEHRRVEVADALCVCDDLERLKELFFK